MEVVVGVEPKERVTSSRHDEAPLALWMTGIVLRSVVRRDGPATVSPSIDASADT